MATCKLHGDLGCECKIMNDVAKVVPRIAYDFYPQTMVVTHADYQALEEDRSRFERLADANYRMYQAAKDELASLWAKVGDAQS